MNTTNNKSIKSYLDWTFIGRSAWWLYVIGMIVLFVNINFLSSIFSLPFTIFLGPFVVGSLAGNLLVQDISFIFILLVPLLFVWLVHKRPGWSVALPRLKFEGWNMGMGFFFSGLTLLGTYILYALLGGGKLSIASPDLQAYLPLFLTALFVMLIQTSAEEVTFRGYFMQSFRRFTANPVIIILLTGLAFAIPHLPNLVIMKMPWYAVVLYLFDGSLLAWLAYRSRSLWMPIGWHFANNFLLTILLGEKTGIDVVQGLPIIVLDKVPSLEIIIVSKVIPSLVSIFILAWLLRRREKNTVA
jgi:uncharacterized protein